MLDRNDMQGETDIGGVQAKYSIKYLNSTSQCDRRKLLTH